MQTGKALDNGSFEHDQENKIDKREEKFNLTSSKPTYTQKNTNYFKLDPHNKTLSENIRYTQAMGALLYVKTLTRPDIATTVNILKRRNKSPTVAEWEAVENVIRYLRTNKHLKFIIDKEKIHVLTIY